MKKLALAALLCVFAVPAFAASTNTQPSTDAMRSDAYKSDNSHMADRRDLSDAELTQRIRDRLSGGWFSDGYDQVTVRVYNGDVNLGGSVRNQDDKEKVEKEVRNLDGVRNLISNIAIQDRASDNRSADNRNSSDNRFSQDRFATQADQQLNKKIRDKVSSGIIWDSYKEITLNTNNGVVTIEGFITNAKDQQDLLDKIQKIEGVRAVRSNLNVKR